mgnify:CR=1 FL=1
MVKLLDDLARMFGLGEIGEELTDLLHPARLLDIMQNFSLFSTDKKKKRIKIIPRFQQYEGANKIVERVKEGRLKKGLIWHFQGKEAVHPEESKAVRLLRGLSMLFVLAPAEENSNP